MKLPKIFVYGNKDLSKTDVSDKRLTKVVQEEYKGIDHQAGRKKQEIDYIANIAKDYWPELVKLLDPNNNIPDEKLERILFNETKDAIERMEQLCKPVGNGLRSYDPHSVRVIEKLLGWMCFKQTPEYMVYERHLTEEGIKLLDGLRKIRGDCSVKEYFKK